MATALPAENLVERTTPAQDAANKCTQKGATLKCCNSVSQAVANLIPIQVGVQCNNIDREHGPEKYFFATRHLLFHSAEHSPPQLTMQLQPEARLLHFRCSERPGQHWQRLPSSPVDAMSAFLRQSSFTAKSSVLRTWRA
ncbi:MAG: hypothetical protein Q9200_006255 [Gallowayella weberi]